MNNWSRVGILAIAAILLKIATGDWCGIRMKKIFFCYAIMAIGGAAGLLVGLLAAIIPLRRVLTTRIVEGLRYGG